MPLARSQRLVARSRFPCLRHQWLIAVWTPVAEELPHVAYLGDHVEIKLSHHNLIFIAAGLGNDLAAWIAEITLTVKLANVPRSLFAYAVDGADKITIRHRMSGLLQFPQIF